MKNNKGITLTSLVIYIALIFVITAMVIRITTYFRGNMVDVADTSFETEFEKINLYLLEESKKIENEILAISDTEISFSNGNKYTYNTVDKIIYLNDTIKVCGNVESCLFDQKTAENGKSVIVFTVTISETTKTTEYVMSKKTNETTGQVNIDDYLWGGSLASYYLKVGDYVDYTPDTGTYKVADGETGSGYTTTAGYQEFTTEVDDETTTDVDESLKWRVLSIDEQTGEIELVSATVAQVATPLYLKGADGYNHGVDILNDLCEKLYSNSKGAVGRSLKIEDINEKTTYDYRTYYNTNFGYTYEDKKALSDFGSNARKYPNLYMKEEGYAPGGIAKTGLNISDGLNDGVVNEYGEIEYKTVTGYTDDYDSAVTNNVYLTYTYYKYTPDTWLKDLGINTAPEGFIGGSEYYWIASRCIYFGSGSACFGLRYISSTGSVGSGDLFYTSGATSKSFTIRPVVTVPVELFDFSVGDGSEENPWGMK